MSPFQIEIIPSIPETGIKHLNLIELKSNPSL